LITGATSGLGRALSLLYHGAGDRVFGVGRREVSDLPSGIEYIQADLSRPDALERIALALDSAGVDQLDRLIHNAAVGLYGPFEQEEPLATEELFRVDLEAPIALTRLLAPKLLDHPGSIVSFIGSVASDLPCPYYASYAAAKAALVGFARSLRVEWEDRCRVQCVQPGAIDTGMHAKMGIPEDVMDPSRFAALGPSAQALMDAVESGDENPAVGLTTGLLRTAGRWVPGFMDLGAAKRLPRVRATLPPRPPGSKKIAVITGAADGIGRALAERARKDGYEVLGVDRDGERLAELGGPGLVLDLSSHGASEELVDAVRELGGADLIIHNAGISRLERFEEGPDQPSDPVLSLDLLAPVLCSNALLREGLLRAGGTMVFISSLSRFTGYPGAAVYASAKDGLASYARSLRVYLEGRAGVLTVYPGPTRTAHARRYAVDNSRESKRMPPERLAGMILDAVDRGERTLIPGLINRAAAWLGKIAPALTEGAMRREIYERIEEDEDVGH